MLTKLTPEEEAEFQVFEDYLEELIDYRIANNEVMRTGYDCAAADSTRFELARDKLIGLLKR